MRTAHIQARDDIKQLRRREVMKPPLHLKFGSLSSPLLDLKFEIQYWLGECRGPSIATPTRSAILATTGVALLMVAVATSHPSSGPAKLTKVSPKESTQSVEAISPEVSLEPFTRPITSD